MRKNKFKYWLLEIAKIFSIIIISTTISIYFFSSKIKIETEPNSEESIESSIYDFRELGYMGEITFTINWIDKPVKDVVCQLIDKNFNILETQKTKDDGICKFISNELHGDYYIKIMYNATFVSGGTEYFKSWSLVSLGCKNIGECNYLNTNFTMGPAEWSDKPPILIK